MEPAPAPGAALEGVRQASHKRSENSENFFHLLVSIFLLCAHSPCVTGLVLSFHHWLRKGRFERASE